ncbi:hypothetical protein CDAR_185301 [Caerostris darwini]|uniref:Uncharacterized protein n=1 Tax=Caerostris darwini TaxID=1538125 RepID=A0AAV4SQX8_9ARAC|nr:hypothetical protein CDAR_185301 [Caerostris darwini]
MHDIEKGKHRKGTSRITTRKKKNHNNRHRYPYLQRFSEIEAQKAAAKSPRGQSNYAALCIALHGNAIILGIHYPNATSILESISSDTERPGAGNESPAITVDISNPNPFLTASKRTEPIIQKERHTSKRYQQHHQEKKNHNNRHRFPYLQRFSEIAAQKGCSRIAPGPKKLRSPTYRSPRQRYNPRGARSKYDFNPWIDLLGPGETRCGQRITW